MSLRLEILLLKSCSQPARRRKNQGKELVGWGGGGRGGQGEMGVVGSSLNHPVQESKIYRVSVMLELNYLSEWYARAELSY